MEDLLLNREAAKGIADILRRINSLERNDYFRPFARDTTGLSAPPTKAQITSAVGTPESYNGNTIGLLTDTGSGRVYLVFGDNAEWYTIQVDLAL